MIARDGENVGETWRGARLEWEDNRPLLTFGDGPSRSERLEPVFSRREVLKYRSGASWPSHSPAQ
ncbi:hypothetical protein N7455_009986 [Penicillium solitum]|uniref:uncharacterized protein n=1 Tax=Penicillium solitum TaxID=60172 RepID=UPI00185CFC02|nr:hypothetical protein HAV15_001321 [Penicillium sp. str. \